MANKLEKFLSACQRLEMFWGESHSFAGANVNPVSLGQKQWTDDIHAKIEIQTWVSDDETSSESYKPKSFVAKLNYKGASNNALPDILNFLFTQFGPGKELESLDHENSKFYSWDFNSATMEFSANERTRKFVLRFYNTSEHPLDVVS